MFFQFIKLRINLLFMEHLGRLAPSKLLIPNKIFLCIFLYDSSGHDTMTIVLICNASSTNLVMSCISRQLSHSYNLLNQCNLFLATKCSTKNAIKSRLSKKVYSSQTIGNGSPFNNLCLHYHLKSISTFSLYASILNNVIKLWVTYASSHVMNIEAYKCFQGNLL